VFGGVFDEEFAEASKLFFEQVAGGRFSLVTSVLVADEIHNASVGVRDLFDRMLGLAELIDPTAAATDLQEAYLREGVVGQASATDALHVALATVGGCSMIVSWNFRHIVHFEKIPLYNAVNALRGFPSIAIFSPREVLKYEEEDV
jgi:hypothetical protein